MWRSPRIFGRGWTASGGAHLIGSMADLPYALARVEQDFIVPKNVQSLIWEDLVPGLITSAVLTRWWSVTRNEFHAVGLYQRSGEELLRRPPKTQSCASPSSASSRNDCSLKGWSDSTRHCAPEMRRKPSRRLPRRKLFSGRGISPQASLRENNWGPAGKELDDLLARSHWRQTQNEFRRILAFRTLPWRRATAGN